MDLQLQTPHSVALVAAPAEHLQRSLHTRPRQRRFFVSCTAVVAPLRIVTCYFPLRRENRKEPSPNKQRPIKVTKQLLLRCSQFPCGSPVKATLPLTAFRESKFFCIGILLKESKQQGLGTGKILCFGFVVKGRWHSPREYGCLYCKELYGYESSGSTGMIFTGVRNKPLQLKCDRPKESNSTNLY